MDITVEEEETPGRNEETLEAQRLATLGTNVVTNWSQRDKGRHTHSQVITLESYITVLLNLDTAVLFLKIFKQIFRDMQSLEKVELRQL